MQSSCMLTHKCFGIKVASHVCMALLGGEGGGGGGVMLNEPGTKHIYSELQSIHYEFTTFSNDYCVTTIHVQIL